MTLMPSKNLEQKRAYARKYYKKWNAENRDKLREYSRKYYYNNLEKCRARARAVAAKDAERYSRFKTRHPDAARWQHIKTRYGVTKERWLEMYDQQKGRCYTCSRPEMDCPRKRLCVDHCHATDRVRHLLCDDCNKILGVAQDSIPMLESLISYLREFTNTEARGE